MIIIGAKGHAKEIFDIINIERTESFYFFDNVSNDADTLFSYPIIKSIEEAQLILKNDPNFILALGGVRNRNKLFRLFEELGGKPIAAIADNAVISKSAVLGTALNIMPFSLISADTSIGKGSLINAFASIHHDCILGEFVEVSPGARILGNCEIGDLSTIGTNAVILPKIKIGKNVTIGAGAVVTKDVQDNAVVVGVPGKTINYNDPIL